MYVEYQLIDATRDVGKVIPAHTNETEGLPKVGAEMIPGSIYLKDLKIKCCHHLCNRHMISIPCFSPG